MPQTEQLVVERRTDAVCSTMAEIREIAEVPAMQKEDLDRISAALLNLAARKELFPKAHFPTKKKGKGFIYRLYEDADSGLSLYASAGVPGKYQPPHNHTTWAAIAAIHGDEHNVFYERKDNGSAKGIGALRKVGEYTVRPGTAASLLENDFHTIEVISSEPSLHLHVYGRSLENLPDRIFFETPESTTYKTFPANPNIRTPVVSPGELRSMLLAKTEIAVLDVREQGKFAADHLLIATPLPLSKLELDIDSLVPRKSTIIVLCDGGDGIADAAASRLMRYGYRDISILYGGIPAWKEAGLGTYAGMHVPSKAFGEYVEVNCHPPAIKPEDLARLQKDGGDVVVLDCRPEDEYVKMSLPGAINCPGVELLPRALNANIPENQLIVVNCAGRTRGIIGAQTLIDAGLKNKIAVLNDGIMGWLLAGFDVVQGQCNSSNLFTPGARSNAASACELIGRRFGVRYVDDEHLAEMCAWQDKRTTYMFDVRSPKEYVAGHRPGTRSAPGGQLIQATETYIAARNARVVLVDDDGIRATITAAWLQRMGWLEVFVLGPAAVKEPYELGVEPKKIYGIGRRWHAWIDAQELSLISGREGVQIFDLASTIDFTRGHIPGANFSLRAKLNDELKILSGDTTVILTSPDGGMASLAAGDVPRGIHCEIRVLLGGTNSWIDKGLQTETGASPSIAAINDVYQKPYERRDGQTDAIRAYLAWETGLLEQIESADDMKILNFIL